MAGWVSSSVCSIILSPKPIKYYINANEFLNEEGPLKEAKYLEDVKEFERIEKLFASEESKEKNSPYDWIKLDQINVYENEVVIKIENPEWAIYTDTNSMDPLIDSTANAIEIIPKSEEDIHLGDIIAYEPELKEGIVTHRVIEISYDEEGWYTILKGDNNDKPDPGKVRFEQIKRVIVAIIY